jgi:hypothetical protein
MMQSSPLAIVTMRRDLSARYASTTRQWLAARNAYRRLHEQPVKNIIACAMPPSVWINSTAAARR